MIIRDGVLVAAGTPGKRSPGHGPLHHGARGRCDCSLDDTAV